jgi:hypothetical protein
MIPTPPLNHTSQKEGFQPRGYRKAVQSQPGAAINSIDPWLIYAFDEVPLVRPLSLRRLSFEW